MMAHFKQVERFQREKKKKKNGAVLNVFETVKNLFFLFEPRKISFKPDTYGRAELLYVPAGGLQTEVCQNRLRNCACE